MLTGGPTGSRGTPSPCTQCPSLAPSCGEGRTGTAASAAQSPGSGGWTLTLLSVWEPGGESGATPPPPAAPARLDPARRHGLWLPGSQGERPGGPSLERLAGAEPPPHLHLHEGAAVEAAGGGRQGAPQAAPLGHGGAGRPGPGRCGGRRPAGQGRGTDRAGHRLRVPLGGAITSSSCRGRSREAGRGDPTLQPAPGGEGAIVPPSARPRLPAPRPQRFSIPALHPRTPGCWGALGCGVEDLPRRTSWGGGRRGMEWDPLGPAREGVSCLPHWPYPSLTRRGQRL